MDKIISPDKSRTASRTVSRDSFVLEDLNDFGETPEAAMNNLIYGTPKIPIDFESFRRSNEDFQVVRQVHSFDSIEFRDRGKHTISLQKQQQFSLSNSPKKFGESLASESTATIGDDYDVNSRKHVINLMQPKDPKQKEDPKKSFSPSFPIMRAYSDDTQNNAVYHSDSIDSTATEHQFERSKREVKPQEEYLVNEQMALQADIEMFNSNEEKRAARAVDQAGSFLLSSEFDEQKRAAAAAAASQQEQRERKNSFNSLYNLDQQSPAAQQQPAAVPGQATPQMNKVTSSGEFNAMAAPSQVSPAGPNAQNAAATGGAAGGSRRQPSPVTGPPGLNRGGGPAMAAPVAMAPQLQQQHLQQQQYDTTAYGGGVAFDSYGAAPQQQQHQAFLGSDLGRYDLQQQQQQQQQGRGYGQVPPPASPQMQASFGAPRPQQFPGLGLGGGAVGVGGLDQYDARNMTYGNPALAFRPAGAAPQSMPLPQANLRGGYAPPGAMGGGLPYGSAPPGPQGGMMTAAPGNRYMPQPPGGNPMGMSVVPPPAARLGPYVSPLTGPPMGGGPDQRFGAPSAYPGRMGGQYPQSMGLGGAPQAAGFYGAPAPAATMPGPAYGATAAGAPYGLGAGPFATGAYVSPFSGMGAATAAAPPHPYGMQQQSPYGGAAPGTGAFGPMHGGGGGNGGNQAGGGGGGRGKYGYGSNRATNTNNLISAGLYDGTGTVYVVSIWIF